jgi:hypothetical protein
VEESGSLHTSQGGINFKRVIEIYVSTKVSKIVENKKKTSVAEHLFYVAK